MRDAGTKKIENTECVKMRKISRVKEFGEVNGDLFLKMG
jgi:hypothetical protein